MEDNPHSDLAFYVWYELEYTKEEFDDLLYCLEEGPSYMTFGFIRPYGKIQKAELASFDLEYLASSFPLE